MARSATGNFRLNGGPLSYGEAGNRTLRVAAEMGMARAGIGLTGCPWCTEPTDQGANLRHYADSTNPTPLLVENFPKDWENPIQVLGLSAQGRYLSISVSRRIWCY